MKVSKEQSQPETVAAAFPILYVILGALFLYQVLIVAHMKLARCDLVLRLEGFQLLLRGFLHGASGNFRVAALPCFPSRLATPLGSPGHINIYIYM